MRFEFVINWLNSCIFLMSIVTYFDWVLIDWYQVKKIIKLLLQAKALCNYHISSCFSIDGCGNPWRFSLSTTRHRTFEVTDLNIFFRNESKCVHLWNNECHQNDQRVKYQSCSKQCCLVDHIKSTEVGSEKCNPYKKCRHDTKKNIPRFVEIVWQASCNECENWTCSDK